MSGTLPFGTNPYAPPVSPLATPATVAVDAGSPLASSRDTDVLNFLRAIANGDPLRTLADGNTLVNNRTTAGYGGGPGDRGAGFTGAGLRGDMPNVTRADMDLGPQAGLSKSLGDLATPAMALANFGRSAMAGPVGVAFGLAQSPPGRGLMSNIANYGAIADKTAATAARGGPAQGGSKGGGDKPSGLSNEEAAAQAANAAATGDMGGAKSGGVGMGGPGDKGGVGGSAGGMGDPGGGTPGQGEAGNTGLARGGLIELAGGGKIAMGPGGGMDDLIPTTIEGQRAAALSDGEFVMPADVVAMMGDGSTNAGSQRLYDLVRQIREAKTGTGQQAEPLQFTDILRRTLG
jgi:hypothetical protein